VPKCFYNAGTAWCYSSFVFSRIDGLCILIKTFLTASDLWTGRGYNSIFLTIYCILCLLCPFSWKGRLWICGYWCLLFIGKQFTNFSALSPHFCVFYKEIHSKIGCSIFLHQLVFKCWMQALSVFFLYVRCTAIDPADQGVTVDCDKSSKNRSKHDEELAGWTLNATSIYWFSVYSWDQIC